LSALTVAPGGTLTASGWDGSKGGLLFVRVSGVAKIQGEVKMDGAGFRAGKPGVNTGEDPTGYPALGGSGAGTGAGGGSHGTSGGAGGSIWSSAPNLKVGTGGSAAISAAGGTTAAAGGAGRIRVDQLSADIGATCARAAPACNFGVNGPLVAQSLDEYVIPA